MSSSDKIAKAFAPGNISCAFAIRKSRNPEKSGSLGLGFTVNKGVVVSIKKIKDNNKKNLIIFNNKKINFPTVNSVIENLSKEKVEVRIKSDLPLGSGFGLSGASALATAYALNKLLKLKKSKRDLAFTAHVSEVENLTGLGDVVNQFYGGFLVKYKPSYMFEVERLPIKNKKIYYRCFSGVRTKKIISDDKIKNNINASGLNALRKIKKLGENNINLKVLIYISKEFSEESGLLRNKNVIETINSIEKNEGNASMIMLGNSVFSDTKFKGSKMLRTSELSAYLLKS